MFPQYELVQIITRDPHILGDLETQLKRASGENGHKETPSTKQKLEFQFDIWNFPFEPTQSTG